MLIFTDSADCLDVHHRLKESSPHSSKQQESQLAAQPAQQHCHRVLQGAVAVEVLSHLRHAMQQ